MYRRQDNDECLEIQYNILKHLCLIITYKKVEFIYSLIYQCQSDKVYKVTRVLNAKVTRDLTC